jgi:hypothetical protein
LDFVVFDEPRGLFLYPHHDTAQDTVVAAQDTVVDCTAKNQLELCSSGVAPAARRNVRRCVHEWLLADAVIHG